MSDDELDYQYELARQDAYREWLEHNKRLHPNDPARVSPDCEKCGDSGSLPNGDTCPDCCSHDEHDHGYCLDCGKDIMDNLINRAELLKDE